MSNGSIGPDIGQVEAQIGLPSCFACLKKPPATCGCEESRYPPVSVVLHCELFTYRGWGRLQRMCELMSLDAFSKPSVTAVDLGE